MEPILQWKDTDDNEDTQICQMKESKAESGVRGWAAVLEVMFRESLSDQVTLRQRL